MSNIFSYDPAELKSSLIEFYRSKPEFADFNYDGSAINTIIDNLVRNTHYIAYMANMVGTESFLDSAQLRSNIVSHAQKLSYTPKSRTSTTVGVDVIVRPQTPPPTGVNTLEANKGSVFIQTIDNETYTFTNPEKFILSRTFDDIFVARGITLKQGQLNSHRFNFNGGRIEVPNKDADTSTIKVFVEEPNGETLEYLKVENVVDVEQSSNVFYLSENINGLYDIDFGKDVLGNQPEIGSVVRVEYVVVPSNHANGIKSLVAATPIEGYSNIEVIVTTPGFGGSERASNELIKFMAPKLYQAQNRAVRYQDYKAIMMREFPFIVTANAWGGEDNVPPYYGKVFVCAVPEQGFVIASPVKTIIENRMRDFSMMTVEVVDPTYVFVDILVKADYYDERTVDTFSQISALINIEIDKYNREILEFGERFDNSLLTSRIRGIKNISSVEITTDMIIKRQTSPGRNEAYSLQFSNAINPGSFRIDGLVFTQNGSNQRIVDDGKGNIIRRYTISNVEYSETIGSIDYVTGNVNFTTIILNDVEFRAEASPSTLNVYSSRNMIVRIDNIDIQRLDTRT